jgi:hypothetical protein
MDILTAFRIIVRRWHVVVSGLILTAVVAVIVMQSISPTFQARGSALVVTPAAPAEGSATPSVLSQNPFTRFDGSTSVLAGVVAQLMSDIEVRENLYEQGAKADYVVAQENQNAPILTVIVEDKDEKYAMESAATVLASINDELDARQADAGAPEASRIRSMVISEPTRTTRLVAAKVRAGVATALLGSAAAISMAFVVEGFAQSRKQREQLRASEDAGGVESERDQPGPLPEPSPRARANGAQRTDREPSEQVTASSTWS